MNPFRKRDEVDFADLGSETTPGRRPSFDEGFVPAGEVPPRDDACAGGPTGDPGSMGRGGSRWVYVVVGVLAVIAVALSALLLMRFVGAIPDSSVLDAASDGAGQVLGAAMESGTEQHDRAVAGELNRVGVVCIDPGHGAWADLSQTPVAPGSSQTQYVEPGGATGCVTGAEEYALNLDIALRLRDQLEARGVTVVMVRETNDVVMSSEARAAVANACGADLFIRLHCDSSDSPSASGFSTLVPGYNEWTADIYEASAAAARIMQPIIIAATGAVDAGIIERQDLAGFNFCDVPSVLFEMGFLSNPQDDWLLNDPTYQETLAVAMADATMEYLATLES